MFPHSRSIRFALALSASLVAFPLAAADIPAMEGFSPADAQMQQALERRFDQALDPKDQRAWLERMTAEPNQVGSPHDKDNAEFILKQFKDWGWDAHIETFDVLYPTPKTVSAELIAPTKFTLKLNEPPIAGDATSGKPGGLPPYNVYGADGDVTGELVYVNYGTDEDYKALDARGVSVKGKIVLARYGNLWRGLKPKRAAEHGAIGCIIYSDPADDGYAQGDVYPRGGFRPADGVQRGSVADMILYPGDPLTPGVGSTPGAKRLALKDAKTLVSIPVLPISYADATPLLEALGGPVAPKEMRGALPLTYHLGPGPAKLHMVVQSDWTNKPIYDVIATIKGSQTPDQWIVRGNHHDGWVFGAFDPLAGQSALLAEAKAIGVLLKQGWKPKRTIVYASWDAEEPGLIGSTEWVEQHAAELTRDAVIYVNSDTNGRGFLEGDGSPELQHYFTQVAADVDDPETHASLLDRARAKLAVSAYSPTAGAEAKARSALAEKSGDLPLSALGTGSDFTPFVQHLGIASINIGFTGEDQTWGVYHSAYDSFDHYIRFGDPGFSYGVALAEVAGRLVLRAADADILPLRFGDVADALGRYVDEIRKNVDDMRDRTVKLSYLRDRNAFALASDPTQKIAPPPVEGDVPFLDFSPLDNAVAQLRKSAAAYQAALGKFDRGAGGVAMADAQRKALNDIMQGMEQAFLSPAGLPGRDWYKHMIYAPGLRTGYAAKTLPAVREAIEARNWDEARRYIPVTAKTIADYADRIGRATAILTR